MKAMMIATLMAMVMDKADAQTWGEWFNQKKTQKKYLIEQIAALKVYAGYLEKGYEVAKDGLKVVNDFKQGEFNLHHNYFSSLKNVNPRIRAYSKVAQIVSLQLEILSAVRKTKSSLIKSGWLNAGEVKHTSDVFGRLLNGCSETLDMLAQVTTNGKMELKDDERIDRIDRLHQDMTANYSFCRSYCNQALLLAANREHEQREISKSKVLNDLKN